MGPVRVGQQRFDPAAEHVGDIRADVKAARSGGPEHRGGGSERLGEDGRSRLGCSGAVRLAHSSVSAARVMKSAIKRGEFACPICRTRSRMLVPRIW